VQTRRKGAIRAVGNTARAGPHGDLRTHCLSAAVLPCLTATQVVRYLRKAVYADMRWIGRSSQVALPFWGGRVYVLIDLHDKGQGGNLGGRASHG
jgi:hypothetical protein